jgi:hypothetical protein
MGVLSRSMLGKVCVGSGVVVVTMDSRLVCWKSLFGCSLYC